MCFERWYLSDRGLSVRDGVHLRKMDEEIEGGSEGEERKRGRKGEKKGN